MPFVIWRNRTTTWFAVVLMVAGASAATVADYGAKADGTLQSEAFQRAIDETSARGGGTLVVPPGRYLVAGLFLKDGVTLRLEEGATLVASTNISDYVSFRSKMPADYDETTEYRTTHSSGSRPSLLHAVVGAIGARNVAIEGKGTIDGRGYVHRKKPKDPRRWRDVLFYRCRDIRVEDVRLRNSALWTCYFKECENVVVRGVDIWSQSYWENDGIDIEARNVLVENCTVDTLDDGICLKNAFFGFTVENVEVRNCRVASCCNFIKFGTTCFGGYRNCRIHDCVLVPCRESPLYAHHLRGGPQRKGFPGVTAPITGLAGISVEAPDGGRVSDIRIWNIDMTSGCVQTPIFIRLERRELHPDGRPGSLEDILIENVTCVNAGWIASSITGVPGLRVRNVTLRNIDITTKPGAARELFSKPVPECERAYPTPNMFKFHVLPASGFYLRHADGIRFENVRIRSAPGVELRPPIVADDCTDVTCENAPLPVAGIPST